jgi:uncharacterized short protein YbdD (DUF466 family)
MWPRVDTVLRAVRRISGMPDYATYVEQAKRCHPERPVASERQFYEEYLRTRYESGQPTRCC